MDERIVLIGTGRMAQVHAHHIAAAGGRVVAVVGRPDRAGDLAGKYGAIPLEDLSELGQGVARTFPWDGALVASATDRHSDHLSALIPAGKPLFCEKPISESVDEARRLEPLAQEAGVAVMLGHHKRHDPHFRELREAIRGEELHCIHLINYDPLPPSQQARLQGAAQEFGNRCGSVFVDFTVHDFDTLRFLTNEEFDVTNVFHDRNDETEEEEAVVLLRSRTGRLRAVIENSRNCGYGHDQRVHAFGPQGQWQVANPLPVAQSFLERYGEAYRRQMAHFLAVVRGEAVPQASLNDGLRSLELAERCEAVVSKT